VFADIRLPAFTDLSNPMALEMALDVTASLTDHMVASGVESAGQSAN
jgi:hypothetical protein